MNWGEIMDIQLDTAHERDIDLLIIEEFIADAAFAKIFTDASGINEPYSIDKVIHSKTDADLGESDIVFILNIFGKRHALHIEDKIDAIAMPRQCDRYTQRGQKDIAAGQYDSFSVLIVAPEKYLANNKVAQEYSHSVTYEQLRTHFLAKTDIRSKYKLALIDRAIYDQKNGYQYEANPNVIRFCAALTAYQKENYPSLPVGTIAWWPGYPTLLKDAILVFKANKGFCDLQFGHTIARNLYAQVKEYLSARMTVVQAGKSASIRIVVTPVMFENPFEKHITEVNEALTALTELYELSKKLAGIEGWE